MKTVLLLGAGGAAANSVARCLTRSDGYRVIGANCDPYDLALAETNERHLIPRCGDRGWKEAILRLVDETKPDFVHAQPESEVLALSEMRHDLPGGDLMVSEETLALTQDKLASWLRWDLAGLPVPETHLILDRRHLARAFSRLGGTVWLRSVSGAGGAGALLTKNYAEAAMWITRHDGWGKFTAAAVLGPETVVFQSLWRSGKLIVGQSKRRLRWANARNVPSGIGGSAAISETVSGPKISEIAIRAVLAIDPDASGVFNVDMALDADGIPNPTEINAGRFNTTVDFFAVAGLNLPDWHFAQHAPLNIHEDWIEPLIDPLGDGLLWIRSMDRPPVFTTSALMAHEADAMVAA